MKRVVLYAFAAAGFAASAHAADLGDLSLKDPLPDTLTWHGITLYGTVDVGYGFETHGLPYSGALYTGQDYVTFGNSKLAGSYSSLTNSALSQSFVGLKVEENLGLGWTALAKLETGFNPLSGELADACASLVRSVGVQPGTKFPIESAGDGSRCGQAINGPGYVGLSNTAYGTITIGRQNSLDLDAMAVYDPMALSYALSALGWSGSIGGGIGSTETARWDNSIKYAYAYGPFHVAGMFAFGTADSSLQRDSGAGDVGFTWKGFSVDALYTKEQGVVNAVSGVVQGINQLNYNSSTNEAYSVMAKYTFDLGGGWGFKDGGYKDPILPTSKVTFYGGYQHTSLTNGPNLTGETTIGGYALVGVDNLNYGTARVYEVSWAGAKLDLPSGWSFTAAYYNFHQDAWTGTIGLASTAKTVGCSGDTATTSNIGCSGNFNEASFLVDYAVTKHFDVYAGANWNDIVGGLAHSNASGSAYFQTNDVTFISGVRLKF